MRRAAEKVTTAIDREREREKQAWLEAGALVSLDSTSINLVTGLYFFSDMGSLTGFTAIHQHTYMQTVAVVQVLLLADRHRGDKNREKMIKTRRKFSKSTEKIGKTAPNHYQL